MIGVLMFMLMFVMGGIAGFILCSLLVANKYKLSMKFINITTTVDEQNRKCIDELCEFIEGVNVNDHDNIIEEFFDVIQSMLGVIKLIGIKHMLGPGLVKHNKKLESRGWILENINK